MGGKVKKSILFFGDIALLYASLVCALFIRYGIENWKESLPMHITSFPIIFGIIIFIFYLADLYKYKNFKTKWGVAKLIIKSLIIVSIVSVGLFYLFPNFFGVTPKTNLFIFIGLVFVFSFALRSIFMSIWKNGSQPTLLLGTSPIIEEIKNFLFLHNVQGYKIIPLEGDNTNIISVCHFIREKHIGIVVVDRDYLRNESYAQALYELIPYGVNIISAGTFYEFTFERIPREIVTTRWFLDNISAWKSFYDPLKRFFDICIASIGCIILSPIICIIAILVKMTSRGPIIYKQERIGKGGIPFMLYKFRTMKLDAEKDGPKLAEKKDNRITFIGNILRKSHLDEAPQLWNIIKGNISFVGPRPERQIFIDEFKQTIPFFETRCIVRPGLTGWAQINAPYASNEDEMKLKLEYDLFYLKHRSLVLDVLVIIKTIRYIFTTHA